MTWLERLLGALVDAGVEFILVGGMAARAHGSSRVTQDVDVSYARSDANLTRIVAALAPPRPYLRGAPPGLPFDWSAKTLRRGLNFTLTTTSGDINLLGEITGGGSYEDLLPHSTLVPVFGTEIRILRTALAGPRPARSRPAQGPRGDRRARGTPGGDRAGGRRRRAGRTPGCRRHVCPAECSLPSRSPVDDTLAEVAPT
jgi:hypothetical protein